MPRHWSQVMGGSQYQAKCIIEELQKLGKYEIFYLTRGVDPNYTATGYQLVHYRYIGSHRQGIHRHFFELAMLPGILKRIDPDIIYQRVGCAQTGIAAHYAGKHHCRMVWHIAHEYDVEPPRLSFSRLLFYRQMERAVLNYGIRHATHIIAQTEDQKRLLENNFMRTPSAVIPNFHPPAREPLTKDDTITVVWVANLKDMKQPEIFIRLARELQDVPNVKFKMIGAMQGNHRKRRHYTELIEGATRLQYLGFQSQDVINEILSRSHIFVNTSEREGFPNTFIQAWFREVPVVSLKVDPDHLIKNHGLGLVSGSVEQLKHDVSLLINDHDLRKKMGVNALAFATNYFSTKNMDKIIRIFNAPR